MPHRLLVVEDSLTNMKLALGIIERLELKADGAMSGLEAIERIQRQHYDAVLMDISMPEMDGLEATRAIRMLGYDAAALPIIAVTANALPEDQEACLAAGMNDFMAKPLTPAKLRDMLARHLPELPVASASAPLAAQKPAQILDLAALATLEEQVGREALNSVLEQFVEELDQRKAKLTGGDIAAIRRESHALKSTAATFGAVILADAAAKTEHAARLGLVETTQLAAALPPLIDAARDAMVGYLAAR